MIWCLHGAVGHSSDWNDFSQKAAAKGHVVRKVDLWRYLECRSIGLEEFGTIFSSEVAAQDTEPTLIGYSMGGRLALQALTAAPTLWRNAINISTHPGLVNESDRLLRRQHDAEWSARCMRSSWNDFLDAWNRQPVLNTEQTRQFDRRILEQRKNAIARSFIAWSLGQQKNMIESLSNITCPTLLLTGEHDQKFTVLAGNMQKSIPDATHTIIPRTGHRTLWDAPKITSEIIFEYLTSTSSP